MVHRDPNEYVASRLTLWILAFGLAVWTLWFLVAGAVRESAPPLPTRPPAYASAASTDYAHAPQSLAEEHALSSRS